jgi:hypothetical protein
MEQEKCTNFNFKKLYPFIFLTNPPIVILSLYYLLSTTQDNIYLYPYIPKGWDFESKLTLLSLVGLICTIFIFINIAIIALLRLVLVANPLEKDDPLSIKVLNRVLNNTIEQLYIFSPALCYWTIRYCKENDKHLVLIHGLIWFIGRVLFLLGYSLSLIDVELAMGRALGIGFTVINTFIVIGKITINLF